MSMYPLAESLPSRVAHQQRPATWGIVIHDTEGHVAGDISVLRGPNVDVQFYVEENGHVVEFLDSGSEAWHAFQTANTYCIGIEHEGNGSAWTPEQTHASARLVAWLCVRYGIPIRHTSPHPGDVASFRGVYGHLDLTLGHVDQNDHTDTLAKNLTWPGYLDLVASYLGAVGGKVAVERYGFMVAGGAVNLPGKWGLKAYADHHRLKLGTLGSHAYSHRVGIWWHVGIGPNSGLYSTAAERDADAAKVRALTGRTVTSYSRRVVG